MRALRNRVQTINGVLDVRTSTHFAFFFNRPHTSVLPSATFNFSGFQARYRTADENILRQFHSFWLETVVSFDMDLLIAQAKLGVIVLLDEYEHLRPYFLGFNA
jgi:hypothetical protein